MLVEIGPDDVRRLQGGAGALFTRFVDSLVLAEFQYQGIDPTGALRTNLRTTIPDGGVDTEVTVPLPAEPASLSYAPSVWQHKAQPKGNLRLGDLFDGAYVQERIRNGDAFRVALADSVPASDVADMEREMLDAARKLNPACPEPMLLTADDLARWANRYPGVVLTQFRTGLETRVLHLASWGANITELTPTYIYVQGWEPTAERILRHVRFDHTAGGEVALLLQGASGVGKTRLVYEVLRTLPGMEGMVVYVEDDPAAVARAVANDPGSRTIIIADECSPECHLRITEMLRGHADRVRVVAINNEPVRVLRPAPNVRLARMDPEELEAVLAENYGHIDAGRRRAYARLANGYPRFAADLCRHDEEIQATGTAGVIIPSVQQYLGVRFGQPDERAAINLLSLFSKLGYREEVRSELTGACELVNLNPDATRDALQNLHDSTGFVARGGRYYYVTPQVIADAAFEEAWIRWAADDPSEFMERIPEHLQRPFLDRIAEVPNEEVRRICGDYFRGWEGGLTPSDLGSPEVVERLVALADTNPERYLPTIRRLVEDAPIEQLKGQEQWTGNRWGPRRQLVWVAERFAQLPDFFDDAERILLRLALAESEPDLGNNATNTWSQLYRIVLSGTAVPFMERLQRLRTRLTSANAEERRLAVQALDTTLATHATRILGPAVVAGRIPPPEWRPPTVGEEQESYRGAVHALIEVAVDGGNDAQSSALRVFATHVRTFLNRWLLNEIEGLAEKVQLPEDLMAQVLDGADLFLEHDADGLEEGSRAAEYRGRVEEWRRHLLGKDLHSVLVYHVASDPWASRKFDREHWGKELAEVARMALSAPERFIEELPWLLSPTAQSAGEFGEHLGRQDSGWTFLQILLESAATAGSLSLIQGYVGGAARLSAHAADLVTEWLNDIEATHPTVAAEIARSAPDELGLVGRVWKLFDAGKLAPRYLHALWLLNGTAREDLDVIEETIGRLKRAAEASTPDATRVGVESLGFLLRGQSDPRESVLSRPTIRDAAWTFLAGEGLHEVSRYHLIPQLIRGLAEFDPDRAVGLAVRWALTETGGLRLEGDLLPSLAEQHPLAVMRELGRWATDEEYGWKFFIADFTPIVAALPIDVVKHWVQTTGVDAARALARHLPEPRIEGEEPLVPPLTAWVLTEFESDDRVFSEFSAGVNSFRLYRGDIAAAHEAEAQMAERFLHHPIRRIREWAEQEARSAREWARRERIEQEEQDLR